MKLEKVKIIIVDDSMSFRLAAKAFLEGEAQCEVIAEATNGAEFLALQNIHIADVILMDMMMPEMDGLTAGKKATWLNRNIKMIAVTMFTEQAYLIQLIQNGFRGCVYKTEFFDNISEAIIKVMDNKMYFPSDIKFGDL